jgi:haloacetate dehalogenase
MFEGFTTSRAATANAKIHLHQGGRGSRLRLLHACPETRVMWHKIATTLARRSTAVCPDSRSYGDSSKPPGPEKAVEVSGRALPCGHVLSEEAPEDTLAALDAFLEG